MPQVPPVSKPQADMLVWWSLGAGVQREEQTCASSDT
jgi:hypothetical protein